VRCSKEQFEGKDLKFTITTNGSLFNDEIIQFLSDNSIITLISLDGAKEQHDANRVFASNGKGTFDVVMKNLNYIHYSYPNFFDKISINAVVDPGLDFGQLDSLFEKYPILKKVNFSNSILDDTFMDEKKSYSTEYITKIGT